MLVYVITDEWDEGGCKVIGVTFDEEQAKQICEYSNETDRHSHVCYEAYDTDEFLPFSQGKTPYTVKFLDDSSYEIEKKSYASFTPNEVWHPRGSLNVSVYATDEKDAWKTANEVLAVYNQYLENPPQALLDRVRKNYPYKPLTDEEAKDRLCKEDRYKISDFIVEEMKRK